MAAIVMFMVIERVDKTDYEKLGMEGKLPKNVCALMRQKGTLLAVSASSGLGCARKL